MNSRNEIPKPTSTISVMPVAACGCSAFARAMSHSPQAGLASGDGLNQLSWSGLANGFQLLFHRANQVVEALLKGIPVTVGGASDPERVFASLGISDGHRPEPHVHYVEH